MEAKIRPPAWKTLSAFAIIYFVWGSTFFAIRVGIHEVPPFLFAAIRFLIAGLALFSWMIARGERLPNLRQWLSVGLVALLIFVFDYLLWMGMGKCADHQTTKGMAHEYEGGDEPADAQ